MRSIVRRLSLTALLIIPLAILGPTTPSRADSGTVDIGSLAFVPQTLNVAVGTTVVWTNDDYYTHTVTSDAGAFSSSNLDPGMTYSFTFTQAGTYQYHCAIHTFMHGTIVVGTSPSATPIQPTSTVPPATAVTSSTSPVLSPMATLTLTSVPTTATSTTSQATTSDFSLNLSGGLVKGKSSSLRVTVKDAGSGQAVPGASLTFDGRTIGIASLEKRKTDSRGTARFSGLMAKKSGRARLTVTKSGYHKLSKSVKVR